MGGRVDMLQAAQPRIQCREHVLANGRSIRVYDDVFDMVVRESIYEKVVRSSFRIGWTDTNTIEHSSYRYLHASYGPEQLADMGIMFHLCRTPVFQECDGFVLRRAVANLSTPSDVHFPHVHDEERVLLYYVNPEWRANWHGETLFYDESLRNIELASPYVPGRITVFDGRTPHSIRPQSSAAPNFRFTLALFFERQAGDQAAR